MPTHACSFPGCPERKSLLVARATAASACAARLAVPAQLIDEAATSRANARLKGCDSSCANARAHGHGPGLLRVPRNQRVTAAKTRQATPGLGPCGIPRHALVWRVACDAFLHILVMLVSNRKHTKAKPRCPQGIVGDDRERRVVAMKGQAQQRFRRIPRAVCNCSRVL
jgi:hypothetical protein